MVNKSDASENCLHIIIGEKPDVCGFRVEVISKNVDLRNVEAALAAVQWDRTVLQSVTSQEITTYINIFL